MPDKWDSPDGQTHDESELMATDEEWDRLTDILAHMTVERGEDSESVNLMRRILARLDAAERERDALKAAMPKVTESDRKCANLWLYRHGPCPHHGLPANNSCRLDELERWKKELTDIIAARVAEAVRPFVELRNQVIRYYDGLPGDVEVPEFVATARRLMEEADRD